MVTLVVRPLAAADLGEAFGWYEQRSVSLGVELLRAVDVCFDAIVASPLGYPVVYQRVRRILLRRFPYAIFYIAGDDRVDILACTHTRRHPRVWRRRT